MPESLHCLIRFLEQLAPLSLAESWDNVGLLLGDPAGPVDRVMTCLTVTPPVVEEARQNGVQLIVSHHPILFRPVQRITAEFPEAGVVWRLAASGIAVYSPHTAYDSASAGINQQLAESLGLTEIAPIRPADDGSGQPAGGGRLGRLAEPMQVKEFLSRVQRILRARACEVVGDVNRMIERIGIACGSAGEFLGDAQQAGCDLLLTGETRFHTSLEAQQRGMVLVLAGHYATERPGIEWLAVRLQREFPRLKVWASKAEQNPLSWWGGDV